MNKPTSPFRFFVDDGSGGKAGTSGAGQILFQTPDGEITQGDASAGLPSNNGGGGSGDSSDDDKSGGTATTMTKGHVTLALLLWSVLCLL